MKSPDHYPHSYTDREHTAALDNLLADTGLRHHPVRIDCLEIADRLDSIDAAAIARAQARRFAAQDAPAMPARPTTH